MKESGENRTHRLILENSFYGAVGGPEYKQWVDNQKLPIIFDEIEIHGVLVDNKFEFVNSFQAMHFKDKESQLDFNQFSYVKKIGDIHYLFYSDKLRHFTLAVKKENPKGEAGGGMRYWETIMIPRIIYTRYDVIELLKGLKA